MCFRRALAPASLVLVASCAPETSPPPNVILITLDTLRADHLVTYGHSEDGAPFLSRLARESAVFERAYSSSSWTAPATASLLTGVYADRHGVDSGFLVQLQSEEGTPGEIVLQAISSSTPTLAQTLRDAGYTTFALTANVNVGSEMSFDRGFDRFERRRQWPAGEMLERVGAWRNEILAAEPYFLYLHFNDVHKPYEIRKRWYRARESEPDETIARYRSELGYLDHQLEKLSEELGWSDDEVIVVVSDHGEEFLDHGQWGHHFSLYGELNRIVFFVRAPSLGVEPVGIEGEASIVDVVPTLLELLSIQARVPTDGVSWASRLRGEPGRGSEPQRALFAHRVEGERELWAVIEDGWKLIVGPDGVELYELEEDPGETRDRASELPDRVAELSALLERHRGRPAAVDSRRTGVEVDDELLRHLKDLGYVE